MESLQPSGSLTENNKIPAQKHPHQNNLFPATQQIF